MLADLRVAVKPVHAGRNCRGPPRIGSTDFRRTIAMNDQPKARQGDKFKQAIDRQNRLETAPREPAKRARDSAEGEAAKSGLPHLEKHSKGRPKQND
jgi:hypothetical protein